MMEIPAGKRCFDGRSDDKCCLFYEPDGFCKMLGEFSIVGEKKLPACLSAYPNGATVTITPKGAVND